MIESERIAGLVKKFKNILPLSNEKFAISEGTEYPEAQIDWDDDDNNWIVRYKPDIEEYYIAHELGHVNLARLCNYEGFAKQMKENSNIDWNIAPLLNILLDGFVDYQISQFDEIYSAIKIKFWDYLGDINFSKRCIQEENEFIELLIWYLGWYQGFNFILKKNDQKESKEKIDDLLSFLKSKLVHGKGGISGKNFIKLTIQLNKFDKIKGTLDSKEIISYCFDVILSMKLWDKNKISEQIKLFFENY